MQEGSRKQGSERGVCVCFRLVYVFVLFQHIYVHGDSCHSGGRFREPASAEQGGGGSHVCVCVSLSLSLSFRPRDEWQEVCAKRNWNRRKNMYMCVCLNLTVFCY